MAGKSKSRTVLIIIIAEFLVIGILFILIASGVFKSDDEKSARNEQIQSTADATAGGDKGKSASSEVKLTPEEEALAKQKAQEEAERLEAERIAAEERAAQELAAQQAAAFETTIAQADIKAAMYDYDAAVSMIKEIEGYDTNQTCLDAIARYEELKSKLVVWADNTKISHIFVHSLIVDTSRCFGPAVSPSQRVGYNRYMTTISEFNKMIESMYERGYVMVSLHDVAEMVTADDGTEKLVMKEILLPEGKIPFVLSQDDVNYYAYMDNSGFADRIVLGPDGLPTCQYTDKDGTVTLGEYDMLPIIDRFVKEHPDFSYHGHKGILALTGYEGALGYDTGLSMKCYDGLDEAEKMQLIEAEREKCREVAEAIKADGWDFASHSYTHFHIASVSLDKVNYDIRRWHEEVELLVGPTDIYIYPYGEEPCDWHAYKGEKYEALWNAGFRFFCNVDASQPYWVQYTDKYYRMGRINTDGERMHLTPHLLKNFFDAEAVYDNSRMAWD